MTAQFHERLRYQGEDMSMCSEPLSDYFRLGGVNPGFEANCTALWRGYVGSWEIVGARLYLVGLTGTLRGSVEATLETVFPGFPDRVFAHWYTGTLRIPDGRRLHYVHMGWGSTFERDVLIEVERGILNRAGQGRPPTAPATAQARGCRDAAQCQLARALHQCLSIELSSSGSARHSGGATAP